MCKQRTLFFFFSTLVLASICASARCESAEAHTELRIGGTGSALPAMRLLAKAYCKRHPDVSIRVVPSLGSPGGIAALGHGALDIAISARPLNKSEQHIRAAAVEYARTPFIFAAHKDVPKSDLSSQELAAIYSGKTVTWPNGTFIRLILRPANDADTETMRSISPAVAKAVQIALQRPGMTVAATNDEADGTVTRVPGALTPTTLSEILAGNHRVKILSYNGVKPTLQNLDEGRYPLYKPLYLLTPAMPSEEALRFVAFLKSAEGRAILTATGNLPSSKSKGR